MSETNTPSEQEQRRAEYERIQATTESPQIIASELPDHRQERTSVVKLIVKLERLVTAGVPALRRIHLLRTVDAKIARIEHPVAPPTVVAGKSGRPAGLLIEHRIGYLMARNLMLALVDLDKSTKARARASKEDRPWLIRRMFDFHARSIELSLTTGRPWTPGIWREIHDLREYLLYRRDAGIDERRETGGETFGPEFLYKRLLLLGLLGEMGKILDGLPEVFRRLPDWARQTRLKDPRLYEGTFGVYLVEVSKDIPARKCPDVVQMASGAWILEPARGFLDYTFVLPDRWDLGAE